MHTAAYPRELLTVGQVARRLSVSVDTVRRRIRSGELRAVRLGGNERAPLRVDPVELEQWLYGEPERAA